MSNALPDLRLLRIFAAVVRHQGFAAAQQELNLSTSAISTYMSQLENQLGIVLCHRGRGGFSLTSKGELFHQETLRILGELEGFERYALAQTPAAHRTGRRGAREDRHPQHRARPRRLQPRRQRPQLGGGGDPQQPAAVGRFGDPRPGTAEPARAEIRRSTKKRPPAVARRRPFA